MGVKTLTAYFFSIEKMQGVETTPISKYELELATKSISELKLDRNKSISRFYNDGIDERYLILKSDRNDIPTPSRISYIPGLFIKRRTTNYPYENDDIGNLFQLSLSSEGNELAEVTFFIIDTSLRVLMYVSNLYVGSTSSFGAYFNNRLKEYHEKVSPLPIFSDENFVRIDFPFIANESPENDFNSMIDISTLEIDIAGSLKLLENNLKSGNDDSKTMFRDLAKLAQKTRSNTIKLVLSSGHIKNKLDKAVISTIYKKLKSFFKQARQNNKFIVKGKIDDEVRFLDLLNAHYFHKTSFDYDGRYVPLDDVFKRLYPIMDRYQHIFKEMNKFKEDN